VETPAVTKEIQILADTIFYRDFRVEQFETQQLVEKGGFQREVPVVCSDARTPNLFLQISGALKSYGYMEESKAQWDGKFNQAIQQFQKDNSLPVGDLNLETLQFLGI
jgi:L-lactate utilization protein LutC